MVSASSPLIEPLRSRIQQRKQVALIDHVEEVCLILFLVLIDGCIVVDDNAVFCGRNR